MKTLLMGGAALAAVIMAIVVGVKTFSEPASAFPPSTEPITGAWVRKAPTTPAPEGQTPSELMAKLASLDAGDSTKLTLTLSDGATLDTTMMASAPGIMEVQVKSKKLAGQLSLAQLGDKGNLLVSDQTATVEFERKP